MLREEYAINEEPTNDHDKVINLWPRVGALERLADRLQERQDKLETAISHLRDEVRETRIQLGEQINEGMQTIRNETSTQLNAIEAHLTAQDEAQADIREKVAGGEAKWPQGAIVFVSISGTFAGSVIVAVIAAILNHWFR